MSKLIVANWKSNPSSEEEAIALAQACDFESAVIAPPFLFINAVKKSITRAKLGAQDVFWEKDGPYTGEVSIEELSRAGVSYVIIGHSERRKNVAETDDMINKKVIAAAGAGFKAILCVGENAEVRSAGIESAKAFVADQLAKDLSGVKSLQNVIIAYEPIWAIGTGTPDTPASASEMAEFIKSKTSGSTPVLYGGSVNASNASSFLNMPSIDGALVGGASLKPAEFAKIVG